MIGPATSRSALVQWTTLDPVRYGSLLTLDALCTAASLFLALLFRFEGVIPHEQWANLSFALPILVVTRVLLTMLAGLHRWSFRMSGLHEAIRLAFTTFLGTSLFVGLFFFLQHGLPRTAVALEFFLTTTLMAAYRFGPRVVLGWYAEQMRSKAADHRRTLIVGAGNAGDLLLRDLLRSHEHHYLVVGFVDDDPHKIGTSINGKPVLGDLNALPRLIAKHQVTKVLLAIPRLPPERIRVMLKLCAHQKVSFKIIPASFAYLEHTVTAAMLHDLSPEDLLPRDAVAFDQSEIASLVRDKRILVTGAGGSIGGEIARQVAQHAPEQLILLDLNENELYLLARRLQSLHPPLRVDTQVADIRDADRMLRIGAQFRPHFVFHAAAHKHVPLMEEAPEEAVKNNIFGTLNVARMADASGAERFVFISTDKAVKPSSVMGASKRVAELLVRELAKRSTTAFTAVRFGNVLGSAGSVIPLFKEQIRRGGPVTVTHPECTRFFMTVSEAVGLVLLAGLGGYGELCVLDMGQPLRIAELAEHMISMAGLVPGVDVPIVFTGLRAGEKLAELLLTEEEERSHVVRNRIHVATSPPPPADLIERLEELRRLADAGDRDAIRAALAWIVPTYSGASRVISETGSDQALESVARLRPKAAAMPV